MKRWHAPKNENIENKKVDSFLSEVVKLCKNIIYP